MIRLAVHEDRPRLVLAAGLRTPFARAGERMRGEDAGHLGAAVARELLTRHAVDPEGVDELIAGCVGPPFDQANVARVIALRAGLPRQVPARTVARNCASGMEAVTSAIANIRAGVGDTYLCVGVEVMSGYPLVYGDRMTELFARLARARSPLARLKALASFRPSMLKPRVTLMEGLTDPTTGLIMGKTAEILVRDFGLDRGQCDAYALRSHQRAQTARDRGRLGEEILPLLPLGARKGAASMETDDGIRDGQTMEALAKLKPYFERPDGVVTVGNSCGITDGAVALLVTTEERAKELGLTPLAAIRSFAWAGLDPARMGLGPVFASMLALKSAGTSLADIGVVELNEAFAAQVLACQQAFASARFAREHFGLGEAIGDLADDRLNVNGGAIALGHPVGATGARLLLTTALEMQRGDHALGLATLCIGGGQGGAVVLERMS
jgi:acetyl-CoA C-acetyltransferase/acetyl-CoA acyltransferase